MSRPYPAARAFRPCCPDLRRALRRHELIAAGSIPDTLDFPGTVYLRQESRHRISASHTVSRGSQEPVPLLVVDRTSRTNLSAENLYGNFA